MSRRRLCHRCFPLLAILSVVALGLSGCRWERTAATEKARAEGVLLVGNGPEIEGLDPAFTSSVSAISVQQAVFEGLVTPHPATLAPEPGVAERWEISADGATYRFFLRSDARWSDGRTVTAEDFAFAWDRMRDPATGAVNAALFELIEDYAVASLDELVVQLRAPAPYFLSLLAHPAFFPLPAWAITAHGGSTDRANPWTRPGNFVGNGPFVLKEWRREQFLEVARSATYWDVETVRLEGIRFFPLADAHTEERAFAGGQLHVTETLPPGRVGHYRQNDPTVLRVDPYLGVYYVLLNHRHPALATVAQRRALSAAVDREAIVEKLLGAGQTAAYSFTPPGFADYTPPRLSFEGEHASFAGQSALYVYNSSDTHRLLAEAMREMWRGATGLELVLENVEFRTYLARREAGDFALMRGSWIGDYVDPLTFLELWRTGFAGSDFSGWSDPHYDALLAAAAVAPDAARRAAALAEAEAYLLDQHVMIPIYHYVTVYLLRPEVEGWEPNLLDWHPWRYVGFAPEATP